MNNDTLYNFKCFDCLMDINFGLTHIQQFTNLIYCPFCSTSLDNLKSNFKIKENESGKEIRVYKGETYGRDEITKRYVGSAKYKKY